MNTNDQSRYQQGRQTVTLDLAKYGLSYLADKPLWDLNSTEIDALISAFIKEDIAPDIGSNPERDRIADLLRRSDCRGCGKCCTGANTANPLHVGLEVYEHELKLMGKHGNITYNSLRKRTRTGKTLRNPDRPGEVAKTRWVYFPCMFYDPKLKRCRVYEARPMVCKLYPITLENSFCVKVNCEYGREIYKSFVAELRTRARLSRPSV